MKVLFAFVIAFVIVGCQSDAQERESEEAYRKGIEALEKLSDSGEPEYEVALAYFEEAAHLNPQNTIGLYWKAHTEFKLKKFDESLKTSVMALDVARPNHQLRPQLLVIAGMSSKQIGEPGNDFFNQAIRIYETRINNDKSDFDAIMNKAIAICYSDSKEKALLFLNSLSVEEENQKFLNQIKEGIKTLEVN